MPDSSSEPDYTSMGVRAILELLERELAAPSLEIEARIADEAWPGLPPIEPHHLNEALRQLRLSGSLSLDGPRTTRGGRPVTLITALPDKRNRTAVSKAAARKRLLTGRYLGWAQGTTARESVIGPAAERVVHASLIKAAPATGYRIENSTSGTATRFLGVRVPIGALDNAAILSTIDADGLPSPAVAVPIEVKNVRDWLYPTNPELYQLLTKAALLQQSRPNTSIMPLLIARRMHVTSFRMFKDIGAFAVQTKRQYIGAVDGGADRLQEVRTGLGFLDLIQLTSEDDLIVRRLMRTVPENAGRVASDWATTATDTYIVDMFTRLRVESRIDKRAILLNRLREHLNTIGRYSGGW